MLQLPGCLLNKINVECLVFLSFEEEEEELFELIDHTVEKFTQLLQQKRKKSTWTDLYTCVMIRSMNKSMTRTFDS